MKRQNLKTKLVLIILSTDDETHKNLIKDMAEDGDIILELSIQTNSECYLKPVLFELSVNYKLSASTVIIEMFPSSFFQTSNEFIKIIDYFQSASVWFFEEKSGLISGFRLGFYQALKQN